MPRWEEVKEYTFWGVIIFLLLGPLLAGVLGPSVVYSYTQKHNPAGKPVTEWGTKYMYYSGVAYTYQLNDAKAKKIWLELIDWYEEPERKVPGDDPWVGMAIYDYANLLWGERKRQRAMQYLEIFVELWGENPKIDRNAVSKARRKMRIYRSGA